MSQQLLQCSGSLRNSAVFLMHPVLLELTPHCTHSQVHTYTHTSRHMGPYVPATGTFNEEERSVKGQGGGGLCGFLSFLRYSLSRQNW